ncbi:MAG: WD40 repeat domain-containing protein [Alphaproteobacteria bacterium]|nr:WD40 repeat domain-containing protein [Alphaproteobacteria bacterium]
MPRNLLAFLLSFLVYLIPVVQAHGGTLLGLAVWAEFFEIRSGREPLWLALDAGLALALQAAGFIAFRWILGGRGIRWLVMIAVVPALVLGFNLAYMAAIPVLCLIERDTAPETGDWPVACSVPGASMVGLHTGVTLALERAREVWVWSGEMGQYGILSMPDCAVTPRKLPIPGLRSAIRFATAGGVLYYSLDRDRDGVWEHWYLDNNLPAPVALEAPTSMKYWRPVTDTRGGAIAWLESDRDDRKRILGRFISYRRPVNSQEVRIPLHLDKNTSVELLDFDLDAGRFVLLRNNREIDVVGLDGGSAGEPINTEGRDGAYDHFRLPDGGWVAWDGYRDDGRYRIGWSLPAGAGLYEIPKGRGITAVSASPDGRYIAVSVSKNISIGSVRDAVFALRTADGAEVWRRYFPTYARSHVAFLGSGHLAVTFRGDGAPRVDVLEVPAR